MTESALQIEDLSLSIRNFPILHNVSCRINAGETWSVLGANGAGKSTLLKCLMGIHDGWSGQIRLYGRSLRSYSRRELARRIAYVPQAGSEDLRFPYTVREFVRMGRYPYSGVFGSAHPDDHAAIEEALIRVNVKNFADRPLRTLSGGERQKVFIAAALAQGAEILLLDEPTAFLDYKHQAEVLEILQTINIESKTTLVMVTHDLNQAILTGGQALALQAGRAVWCGPVYDLLFEERLSAIFETDFRLIDDPVTGLRIVAPQGVPA